MSTPGAAQVVADEPEVAQTRRQGVDGGIPVSGPGILDSRNRQQPAQRRSAPVRAPSARASRVGSARGEPRAGCAKGRPHVVARPKTDSPPRTPTPAAPSPFSRASRRSASAPVCTSAPPVSAACTTWCGRSSTTPSTRRWPGTATPSASPCSPTAASGSRTTAVASRSTCTRSRSGPPSRSIMTDPARGREVRRQELRASPVVCTASASPSSTRCPSGSTSASGATAPSGTSSYDLRQARPAGEGRPHEEARHRRSPSGPTATSSRRRTYSFDTISRRLQEMAFLNKGLTIVLRDERPGHSKAETGLAEEIPLAEAAPAAGARGRGVRGHRDHLPVRRRPR